MATNAVRYMTTLCVALFNFHQFTFQRVNRWNVNYVAILGTGKNPQLSLDLDQPFVNPQALCVKVDKWTPFYQSTKKMGFKQDISLCVMYGKVENWILSYQYCFYFKCTITRRIMTKAKSVLKMAIKLKNPNFSDKISSSGWKSRPLLI